MSTLPKEKPPLNNRRYAVLICLILALAALLRAWALFDLEGSIYSGYLLVDERVYHTWAAEIAAGTYRQETIYRFSPFPAFAFALIYKLFGPNVFFIRLFNLLLGTAACGLIGLIASKLAGRSAGLAAALAAALYAPFILYSIVPLKTGLAIFLFAAMIYWLLEYLDGQGTHDYRPGLYLGLSLGALAATREQALVLIPAIFMLLFIGAFRAGNRLKTATKGLVPFVAGLMIVFSPIAINNYRASGAFALTSSQSGINLYFAYNPLNPAPYYLPLPFASSVPFEQEGHFTAEAERRAGRELNSKEASRFWRDETLRLITADPARFIKKVVQKALAFFNRYEPGDHYSIEFLKEIIPFFRLPLLSFGLVAPFGLAALVLLFRASGKVRILAALFAVYASTLVFIFTTTRYRVPLMTILIPLAAHGGVKVIAALKSRQWRPVFAYAGTAMLITLIQAAPVPGAGDMTAYLNTHALALNSQGHVQEAIAYWERSSRAEGTFSAYADISLAARCYERKDFETALQYLGRIRDDSFAAAGKYELLGAVRFGMGETDAALSDFERSLKINSGNIRTRELLIQALESVSPERAAKEIVTLNRLKRRMTPF